MPNPAPPGRRQEVYDRDRRCARCGGAGTDWHHRRSRSVKDAHTHCLCNSVWLCRTCHSWAHTNPVRAMNAGLVVSKYVSHPGQIPVSYLQGRWLLGCAGEAFPT